jgi:hypothetical protein
VWDHNWLTAASKAWAGFEDLEKVLKKQNPELEAKAILLLEEAASLNPLDFAVTSALGEKYMTQLKELGPNTGETEFSKQNHLQQQNALLEKAVTAFKNSVRGYRTSPIANQWLSTLSRQSGELEKSEQHVQLAIKGFREGSTHRPVPDPEILELELDLAFVRWIRLDKSYQVQGSGGAQTNSEQLRAHLSSLKDIRRSVKGVVRKASVDPSKAKSGVLTVTRTDGSGPSSEAILKAAAEVKDKAENMHSRLQQQERMFQDQL